MAEYSFIFTLIENEKVTLKCFEKLVWSFEKNWLKI